MPCAGLPMLTDGALTSRCGLTLRRYSPCDFYTIQARTDYAAELSLNNGHQPQGLAWTMTQGPKRWDRPLMIGGFDDLGHGRWSAWTFGETLSPRAWAMVRHAFHLMVFQVRPRRVEACVRLDTPYVEAARHYARSLGMSFEGVMRSWGCDGTDYELFARVYS